jgi:transposase
MRFIELLEEERKVVDYLYKNSPNSVVRERCMFLKFSEDKKSMMEISRIMKVGRLRVTLFFNAWEKAETLKDKQETLGIKKGRGAKLKLKKVADILPELVKENSRNLNVVLDILEREHQIKMTKQTLINFLKGTKI